MKNEINKILEYGNCRLVRVCGKDAYVKDVSLWIRTFYKADAMDKVAQHTEVLDSVVEVKSEVVHWIYIHLPREALIPCVSGFNLSVKRSGSISDNWIENQGVSRDHSKLVAEYEGLKYRPFKLGNSRIRSIEGSNLRSGNNRTYL